MNSLNRLRWRIPSLLLLLAPVLFYLAIAIYWQSHGFYRITGDEPHYLLITDSLVRDFDLKVDNNYSINTPVKDAVPSDLRKDIAAHTYNRYSRHTIGMPLLLTIPYVIGGVAGARIFMALLAGFWPLLLFGVLVQITQSRGWSLTIAFVLAIGLPFSAASTQIYPDLLTGLVVLYASWKIFNGLEKGTTFSFRDQLSIGLLVAFLPWLHVRLAAMAILLAAAYAYVMVRTARVKRSRFTWRLFLPALLILGSIILLAIYHRATFGSVRGPFSQDYFTLHPKEIAMLFFGLHWDQSQGMFILQPLLLFGLAGVPLLIRQHWRGAIVLALLYLSVIMPAAMHPAFYGGDAVLGRFWWTVAPLWVFPMGLAIRSMLKTHALALSCLLLGAFAFQVWLATRWIFHDGLIMNHSVPVWAARTLFDSSDAWKYLPAFRDYTAYLRHPTNYFAVIAGSLLLGSGWLRGRRYHLRAKLWSVVIFVGLTCLAIIPPSLGSLRLSGTDLPSQIGTVQGYDRVATEKDGSGWLTFGPYVVLNSGLYDVTVEYESSATKPGFAHFDIVSGPAHDLIMGMDLPPPDANRSVFKSQLRVGTERSLNDLYEFRIRYLGQDDLRFKKLTVTPISFDY